MSVRLDRPFRASVAGTRAGLSGRERFLFDLLCCAGQLGYRLPHDDISLRHVRGPRDPRKRLAQEFSHPRRLEGLNRRPQAWARAGRNLARRIARQLTARDGDEEYRALRVLLAYAPAALAPVGIVPRDPLTRAAWKAVVGLFADLFDSTLAPMGHLACLDGKRLTTLEREAASGLKIGRRASGQRAGPEGRRLAVDPRLMALASEALGVKVSPGYQARNLFYVRPGDHFWPHPDDPKYAAQLLICIAHELPPGRSTGSAFLAYRRDGTHDRYEITPGSALIVAPGLVHGREPVRPGERLVMLSVGLRFTPEGAEAR